LSAASDRLVNSVLLNEGVVDVAGDSFEVLENTGSDMNILVGSGTAFDRAVVEGDVSGQGTFICEHQNTSQQLAIAASDPSLDRIDRVVLQVFDDTFDSSGDDESDIIVVEGTPDAAPVAPALPDGAISLASIEVDAGVTAVTDADITDLRAEATLRPAVVDGAVGQWQDWTPNLTNITLGNGIQVARYTQIGKTVHLYWSLDLGNASSVGTNPTISLPVASAIPANDTAAENNIIGVGNFTDTGTASYLTTVRLTSSTTMRPRPQVVSGSNVTAGSISATAPFTWTTDDRMAISATYEAA
jgi:hypothetical protein